MARDIDWGKIERDAVLDVTRAIDESLVLVKDEVDVNTPIDEGELIAGTKIRPAKRDGDRISGSVYNEVEHGKYVEYGVMGRTYNYHKFKRVFYVGVGARMFTRAYDRMKPIVLQKIRSVFNR